MGKPGKLSLLSRRRTAALEFSTACPLLAPWPAAQPVASAGCCQPECVTQD